MIWKRVCQLYEKIFKRGGESNLSVRKAAFKTDALLAEIHWTLSIEKLGS